MFKSILPSRRVPSTEFQMVTPPFDSILNGKENYYPESSAPAESKPSRIEKLKKRKGKEQAPDPDNQMTVHAFEKLLVSVLDVPPTTFCTYATCRRRINRSRPHLMP